MVKAGSQSVGNATIGGEAGLIPDRAQDLATSAAGAGRRSARPLRGTAPLRALVCAVVLALWCGVAAAQDLKDASLGSTFATKAKLGPRQIPLPEGQWTLVSRGITRSGGPAQSVPLLTVYLAQFQGGKVDRTIVAATNLEPNSGGWARNTDICDRSDVHAAVSDRNYNSRDTECWTVNHYGITLGNNPAAAYKEFFEALASKGRPNTALGIAYYIVKSGDFIRVTYMSNPEIAGFEPTQSNIRAGNPWSRDLAASDPKKAGYIAKLKAEGERLLPLVKQGFAGRL